MISCLFGQSPLQPLFVVVMQHSLSLTRTLGVSWREEEFPEWSCALFCDRMQICWLFLVTCLTQMILTDWLLSKPYSMLTFASVFDQKHPLMKGLHKMFVVYLCCTCNQQSFAMAVVVDVVLILLYLILHLKFTFWLPRCILVRHLFLRRNYTMEPVHLIKTILSINPCGK